jgi:hypothetical protein
MWTSLRNYFTGESAKFHLVIGLLLIFGIIFIVGADQISKWISTYGSWISTREFHFPKEIIDELGKALLIAGLLAAAVDGPLKRRLSIELTRNMALVIEGFDLPEQIRDEIIFLRKTSIYRMNFRLEYTLRLINDRPGYCRVFIFVSYDLVNHLPQIIDYWHRLWADNNFPQIGRAEITHAKVTGVGISCYSYNAPFPAELLKTDGEYLKFDKQISIPYNRETYKTNPLTFSGEMNIISEENDLDTFYFIDTTINPTIKVRYPPEMEVQVNIGHRFKVTEPEKVPPPAPRFNNADQLWERTWTLNGAMMPWQSANIEWKRTTPAEKT